MLIESNFISSEPFYFAGELRQLRELVIDAKNMGVKVVAALLKSMLERNMFLFGSVGVNEGSATFNELTDVQNARVQTAYKKYVPISSMVASPYFLHHFVDLKVF